MRWLALAALLGAVACTPKCPSNACDATQTAGSVCAGRGATCMGPTTQQMATQGQGIEHECDGSMWVAQTCAFPGK